MASIAEVVTRYQAVQKSYEKAVARAGGSADAPWTGKSLCIAGPAVAAAGNAVQIARLIAGARERLGSELTEKLLVGACKAAFFAGGAAEEAAWLTLAPAAVYRSARPSDRTGQTAHRIRA